MPQARRVGFKKLRAKPLGPLGPANRENEHSVEWTVKGGAAVDELEDYLRRYCPRVNCTYAIARDLLNSNDYEVMALLSQVPFEHLTVERVLSHVDALGYELGEDAAPFAAAAWLAIMRSRVQAVKS